VTTVEAPTNCSRCDQPLLIRIEGRDVCERCRLGRTRFPGEATDAVTDEQEQPAVRPPCVGCGRTEAEEVNGRYIVAVAIDGYCLSCRVQGFHLGR
jgi:hypothetical protein